MRDKFGRKLALSFILSAAIFFWFSFILNSVTYDTRYRMINESWRHDDSIYLLFWNSYMDSYDSWGLEKPTSTPKNLEDVNCPVTNCIFTTRKNLLPDIHDYDVLFINPYSEVELPTTRNMNQYYVVATVEAPDRSYIQLKQYSNIFNLTMTHRVDSDLLWSYGEVRDIETGKFLAPALDVEWREPDEYFTDENIKKIFMEKSKTAAWFVSNCIVQPSKRNELTKALQKNKIEVDIYGKCGKLKIPKNIDEYEFLEKNYKFYFSFENSLCADYVTEKLFKVMNSYIIPVVFNGADMTRFMPPKSYINANDFDTVEELAAHLKFLSYNPDEYVKYFWWKKYYKVNLTPVLAHMWPRWCLVCQQINQFRKENIHKTYSNIENWNKNGVCNKAKIKF